MKKVLILLMMASVLLGACQDSVQVNDKWVVDLKSYYLQLDNTDVVIDNASGGFATFNVYSQDTPWTISEVPEWITLSVNKGSSSTPVTVTASGNDRFEPRVGVFKFSSGTTKWNYYQYITVTQAGVSPIIQLEQSSFSFDGRAQSVTVGASSNFIWGFEGDDWIHVKQQKNSMTVDVWANDTGRARTGYVSILVAKTGEAVAFIEVMQAAATGTVSTDQLHFGRAGGSYKVTVTAEAGWAVSHTYDIFKVDPYRGDGGTTEVTISAKPNDSSVSWSDRLFFRLIHGEEAFGIIDVTQDGIRLSLDDNLIKNLSAMGGQVQIPLNANIPWRIIEVPDFLTVSPMSGTTSTELTFNVSENPTFSTRWGVLKMERPDDSSGAIWYFTIGQRSRTPNFDSGTYLTCDASAQTLTLNVDTDGPWGIVYNRSFFDVTPTASEGKGTISFVVDENPGEARQGSANFRPHGVEGYDESQPSDWNLIVNQEGVPDNHDIPQAVGLPESAGLMGIDIAVPDTWSAEMLDAPEWARISGKGSGSGRGKLLVAYDDNPMGQSRTARVKVSFRPRDAIILTLRQQGQDDPVIWSTGGDIVRHRVCEAPRGEILSIPGLTVAVSSYEEYDEDITYE